MDALAQISQNTPQCLRSRGQWVAWRYELDKDGRKLKVPYDPRSGRKASHSDPATWGTFEQSLQTYQGGGYDGVGYVFAEGDPFAGIDLDGCVDEAGELAGWAREMVEAFATYSEVSPSGRGVKLFFRGRKPDYAGCSVEEIAGTSARMEVYDRKRFFTVTGSIWPGCPADLEDRQVQLDALCRHYWKPAPAPSAPPPAATPSPDRLADCLREMLAIRKGDHLDGSMRLYTVCCRAVEHDLSDQEAVQLIRTYAGLKPFPTDWTDEQIVKRLRDVERKVQRGAARQRRQVDTSAIMPGRGQPADAAPAVADFKSVRELLVEYPQLRRPVIHGLLRQGETANIIAPPKTGKSWLVTDLALAVATGRPWLGMFNTVQGNVLILDNELHGETSANRIPRVAEARGIDLNDVADAVFVANMRGQLRDLIALGPYFAAIEPGRFRIVVLDAWYRYIPRDTDENDNGSVAHLYNHLDHYAQKLGCSFVLIHHASKGNQSGKSITDVGAGAGSQSRATDAHIVLRAHEQEGVVVLDAAVRSWPPIAPVCLKWDFPLFNPVDGLDPTALKPDRPRRKAKDQGKPEQALPKPPEWDTDMFVKTCVSDEGQVRDRLVDIAMRNGISKARAKALLQMAEAEKKVHRWVSGAAKPVRFATVPQPLIETPKGGRARKNRR
jgi:hypothetical protein